MIIGKLSTRIGGNFHRNIHPEKFVQFIYNPDYLRNYKKWRNTISDGYAICEKIDIKPSRSDIVIDGGNVVKGKNKVIMTSKIFKENSQYEEKELIRLLIEKLEVEDVIIIPQEPKDIFGHADGMVRFLDDNTVLINDYRNEKNQEFCINFRMSLHNAKLDYISIPYNPYNNETDRDATGVYINYLRMKFCIFIPLFGLKEDDVTIKQFEELFGGI